MGRVPCRKVANHRGKSCEQQCAEDAEMWFIGFAARTRLNSLAVFFGSFETVNLYNSPWGGSRVVGSRHGETCDSYSKLLRVS